MIQNIKKYFQGVISETKKVTWPKRKEIINHTIIVVVSVVVLMVIFGSIDLGLSKLLQIVIK